MKVDMAPAAQTVQRDCCVERKDDFTCGEAGREIAAVAAVQRLLLPNRLPQVPGLDLAVSYRPARHASGDYYDFLRLPSGKWGFFIADVSGHGAAAAVVTAAVHASHRSERKVRPRIESPSRRAPNPPASTLRPPSLAAGPRRPTGAEHVAARTPSSA